MCIDIRSSCLGVPMPVSSVCCMYCVPMPSCAQVLPGVEVLCRPALPSKNNNNPRASHKVITATGGLYALDNAFPLVQEALMVGSRGPSGEATATDTRTSITQTTMPPLPSLHVVTLVPVCALCGCAAVGPAVVGVTDVAAPSAPTTRTSRPQ